jgi:hypothetical protein
MIHDAASEKLFAEAASRQAAKIGVIASPFWQRHGPTPTSSVGRRCHGQQRAAVKSGEAAIGQKRC